MEGSSVPLRADESRLYWDPAPPKLDVAPAKVKDVLFPDYQRATAGPQVTITHWTKKTNIKVCVSCLLALNLFRIVPPTCVEVFCFVE